MARASSTHHKFKALCKTKSSLVLWHEEASVERVKHIPDQFFLRLARGIASLVGVEDIYDREVKKTKRLCMGGM